MKRFILFLLTLFTAQTALATRTFYIDYSGGSNSNSGTSTGSPWKSHPYMHCGPAPSYAHQAGDRFIFKGGVTWPATCFQMTVLAGGSSSSLVDYYGVDLSWFSGGSFTRPVFDLAQTVPIGNSSRNAVIYVATSFVTIDNMEIANQRIQISNALLGGTSGISAYGGSCGQFSGITVKNSYLHAWMTNDQITNSSNPPAYGSGGLMGC